MEDKVDAPLRDALAAGGEVRVIITIRDRCVVQEPMPAPNQYRSREDYRKALIERRSHFIRESSGEVMESLRSLGLRLIDPIVMHLVIAHGTADQIREALKLPDVVRASLDRPLVAGGL